LRSLRRRDATATAVETAALQMIILGIDTSGKSGGIAMARADGEQFTLLESAPIEGGTFSSQLIPLLAALLKKHNLKKEDIGGFAVAIGDGNVFHFFERSHFWLRNLDLNLIRDPAVRVGPINRRGESGR